MFCMEGRQARQTVIRGLAAFLFFGLSAASSAEPSAECKSLDADYVAAMQTSTAAANSFNEAKKNYEGTKKRAEDYVNRLVARGSRGDRLTRPAEKKWQEVLAASEPYLTSSHDHVAKLKLSCTAWESLNAADCPNANTLARRRVDPCKGLVWNQSQHETAIRTNERLKAQSMIEFFSLEDYAP